MPAPSGRTAMTNSLDTSTDAVTVMPRATSVTSADVLTSGRTAADSDIGASTCGTCSIRSDGTVTVRQATEPPTCRNGHVGGSRAVAQADWKSAVAGTR